LEYCAINHEIVLSPFILDEVRDKLLRKFDFASREAGDVIQLLRSRAILVTPQKLEKPTCRDPDDDNIPGTAMAGKCECIVTGDKDLPALQSVHGVRVVTPSDFWATEK